MTAPATLAEALAQLQGQMPRVAKEAAGQVGPRQYEYARLEDIAPKLYPVMASLGLSFSAKPTIRKGRFVLAYNLLHVSGESIDGCYPLPDPERYGPQDLGKAITYARRYALCAITGLAPGGDDDDEASAQPHPPLPAPATQADADAQGRMSEQQRARHRNLERDTVRSPKKATRSKPAGPDPDDPWTADPGPVTPARAQDIRRAAEDGISPEDRPGSILPGQHRALEALLTVYGIDSADREGRHQALRVTLGLDELGSVTSLSLAQASEAIRRIQDQISAERAKAAAERAKAAAGTGHD